MEDSQMGEQNEIIVLDDLMICVEVVFEGSKLDIPYAQYRFGNLMELKEKLSDEFLEAEVVKKQADSAYLNNVYFRGKMKDGKWRSEYRVGTRAFIDLEAIILKEE